MLSIQEITEVFQELGVHKLPKEEQEEIIRDIVYKYLMSEVEKEDIVRRVMPPRRVKNGNSD